jgi:predicted metal-dependent phosphoesterase TrpH
MLPTRTAAGICSQSAARYDRFSVLKVELHSHTDRDPLDLVSHSIEGLIDRAAALGYQGLAITLHDRYTDGTEAAGYARERGIVLLPGIERTVARRHVLLINFPEACAAVRTFDDIAALKRSSRGLVIAPHPFYPIPSALGADLERRAELFDAVEVNSMYTRLVNFNARAIRWARNHGKPLVGSTDLHLLEQMGTTYTLVDAEPDAAAICEAIRAGRVEVRTEPLSTLRAGWCFARMLAGGARGRFLPRALRTGVRP